MAARVRWERADLRDRTTTETFDLAAAFYLHTPLQLDHPTTLRRAARQVRPGGALLIVGHHEQPPWGSDPGTRDGFASAADLASELSLDDREWTIKRADRVERSVIHDGRRQSVVDTVLYASR